MLVFINSALLATRSHENSFSDKNAELGLGPSQLVILVLFDVSEVGAESHRRRHGRRYSYRIGGVQTGLLQVLTVCSSNALAICQVAHVGTRVDEDDVFFVLVVYVDVAACSWVVLDVDVDWTICEYFAHLEVLSML